jgi:hypothetical protein
MKLLKLSVNEGYPSSLNEGQDYDAIKYGTWNYTVGETYILVDNSNQGTAEVVIKEFDEDPEPGHTGFMFQITKIYTVTKVTRSPIDLEKDPETLFNQLLPLLDDRDYHDSTELEMITPYWKEAIEYGRKHGYSITIEDEPLQMYELSNVEEPVINLPKTTIKIMGAKKDFAKK